MESVNSRNSDDVPNGLPSGEFFAKSSRTPKTTVSDALGIPRRILIARFFTGLLDVVLTSIGLLLLMPIFLVLAIIINLDSPGSVLFKQKRVGFYGREFWFYKFRSMVSDAEALKAKLATDNEASGPLFKMKNDPRITRSGKVLRKYSLDELPQLINVLKGDMSLVGPRPALPMEVALYKTEHLRRLNVKPGITGLWQISGRSDLSFERAIELDVEYVERQSVLLYVIILVRTIPAVILGRGAY